MAVRIVTDSTCDLSTEVIARHNIAVVPLYINVGNQGFLDGIDMKRDEFYTRLPSFSTTPPPPCRRHKNSMPSIRHWPMEALARFCLFTFQLL